MENEIIKRTKKREFAINPENNTFEYKVTTTFEVKKKRDDGEETQDLKFKQNNMEDEFATNKEDWKNPTVGIGKYLEDLKECKKSQRKQDEWKLPTIIIEIDGQERMLGDFTRQEIVTIILERQHEWVTQLMLNLNVREEIQSTLLSVIGLLDKPRKYGWTIAEFLYGREYFSTHFLDTFESYETKIESEYASKSGLASIPTVRAKLLKDLLLFCGAFLIVEFPEKSKGEKNKRMEFLNMCRQGIICYGKDIGKGREIVSTLEPGLVTFMSRPANQAIFSQYLATIPREERMRKLNPNAIVISRKSVAAMRRRMMANNP